MIYYEYKNDEDCLTTFTVAQDLDALTKVYNMTIYSVIVYTYY